MTPETTPPRRTLVADRPRDADRLGLGQSHILELDGVRGLAIILVMFTHWQAAWTSSSVLDEVIHRISAPGWLGVELFFVLSGFLITRLLLRQRQTADSLARYIGTFMWRRALRIFPLYYATLFLLFTVVPRAIEIHDPAFLTLQHNAAWYWLYGVNWLHALRGGSQTPMNTGHFWSLAVEEQFYLVWPMAVWYAGPKRLPYVCAILWSASVIVRLAVGESFDPQRVTPLLHFDPLMAGAMVAWYSSLPTRLPQDRWLPVVAGVGSLGTFGWATLHGRVSLLLAAVSFGAVVGCLVLRRGGASLSRMFRSSTLRLFGKYSYCLYIVHYLILDPVTRVMQHFTIPRVLGSSLPSALIMGVLMLGSSLLVSIVSWHMFEHPILRLKDMRWPQFTADTASTGNL